MYDSTLYQDENCCKHSPPFFKEGLGEVLNLSDTIEPDFLDQLSKEMVSMAMDLFTAGSFEGINSKVTQLIAAKLWQGVVSGYGKDLFQTTYDSPDYNKLMQLQANVWQFSGAKNLAQLSQLSSLLIDANGKIRSRKDFVIEAAKVNNVFANVYLPAEYDTAIAAATMASKWVDIQTNKKTFGFIQFDAVIDSQTSTICRPLEGIIVPVDSPFLDTYYPPNHWRCRTTVRQLASAVPSPQTELDRVAYNLPLKPQFDINLGKQGWIFSEKHAYFNEITKGALSDIKIAYKQSVYERPIDEQYVSVYKSKNGGEVRKHLLTQPRYNFVKDDYVDVIEGAKLFAEKGMKVDILPEIHKDDYLKLNSKIRSNYTTFNKNPDYKIDELYYDLKRPESFGTVKDNIEKSGNEQSSIAVISTVNIKNITIERIKEIVKTVNIEKYAFDYVYFIHNNTLIKMPINRK